ncbi:MAG: DUF4231 domain-containing protein [Candidatus Thiodiazotropha taylori]
MYDDLIKQRLNRAEQYDKRTRTQHKWYSGKAGVNKLAFQAIGLAVIVLGATVGIVPLLLGDGPSLPDKIVAILGSLIVILKGVERIWLPEEKWLTYRKASEALLREKESYTECIGPYSSEKNEDATYRLYVERCILIKAEEQNNFWGINSSSDKESSVINSNDQNGSV